MTPYWHLGTNFRFNRCFILSHFPPRSRPAADADEPPLCGGILPRCGRRSRKMAGSSPRVRGTVCVPRATPGAPALATLNCAVRSRLTCSQSPDAITASNSARTETCAALSYPSCGFASPNGPDSASSSASLSSSPTSARTSSTTAVTSSADPSILPADPSMLPSPSDPHPTTRSPATTTPIAYHTITDPLPCPRPFAGCRQCNGPADHRRPLTAIRPQGAGCVTRRAAASGGRRHR